MKLFQHSNGTLFSIGFDMDKRVPASRLICWSDPTTKSWEIQPGNQAGWMLAPFDLAPEFVREVRGTLVAYQPGWCIEATYIGAPYIWSIRFLRPDCDVMSAAA